MWILNKIDNTKWGKGGRGVGGGGGGGGGGMGGGGGGKHVVPPPLSPHYNSNYERYVDLHAAWTSTVWFIIFILIIVACCTAGYWL